MADLLEYLRSVHANQMSYIVSRRSEYAEVIGMAADRIEALEAALREIINVDGGPNLEGQSYCQSIAERALEGK